MGGWGWVVRLESGLGLNTVMWWSNMHAFDLFTVVILYCVDVSCWSIVSASDSAGVSKVRESLNISTYTEVTSARRKTEPYNTFRSIISINHLWLKILLRVSNGPTKRVI